MLRRFLGATAMLGLLAGAVLGADFSLTGANTTVGFVGTKPGGKAIAAHLPRVASTICCCASK